MWETTESAEAFVANIGCLGETLLGEHLWETTESAKALLVNICSGELGTRTRGTGSPDAGEPVPPATLSNFYSKL